MKYLFAIFIIFGSLFSTANLLADQEFYTALEKSDKPPKLLYVGAGIFNMLHGPKMMVYQMEYRGDTEIYRKGPLFIRPLLGLMATNRGSTYYYGGIAFDIFLGKYFAITPSFAPGIYFKGGGKDLHYPLEFRSSFEASFIFPNASRLGAMFYHISNASLGRKNPGTECLVFFYAFPLN